MKKKGIKTLAIVLAVIFVLGSCGFSYLFLNGLSGLHMNNKAKENQIKVACVGDSITYGHGVTPWHKNNYPAVLQNLLGDGYNVQNFGVSGTTAHSTGDQPYIKTDIYKQSIEYDADIIIFMLGSNDSKPESWTDAETFKKEYLALLDTYISDENSPEIYLGIPAKAFYEDKSQTSGLTSYDIQGDIVEQIGGIVKEIAAERGYKYIDIYSLTAENPQWFEADFVHPNAEGAKAIANEVYKYVTDIELTDFLSKSEIDSQINLIASILNNCIDNMEVYLDSYGFCVTDLNYNGRLELIVATNGGTGNRTNSYVYEISEDYSKIVRCESNFIGYKYSDEFNDESNADIILYDELTHYFKDNQHFYVLEDDGRYGYAEQYNHKIAISLEDTTFIEKTLASDIRIYTISATDPEITITDYNGNDISEEEYQNIADKYFEGYNKNTVKLCWYSFLSSKTYPNGFLGNTDKELIEKITESYNTFIGD